MKPSKTSFKDWPEHYTALGRRIAAARSVLRLTQAELAARLGITPNSVARIEQGRQRCLSHSVAVIADALGVEHKDLVPPRIDTSNADEPRLLHPDDERVILDALAHRRMDKSKRVKR